MSVSQAMKYFRANPVVTMREARKVTGMTFAVIRQFAEYAGTKVISSRKDRIEFCQNAPHSCYVCPFRDCINAERETVAETEYVNNALDIGRRDARTIIMKGIGENDKSKNKG